MVNEAARCLEEKVVATPEDADYGMILGTGFAPFRGGPLRFADHFGIAEIDRCGESTTAANSHHVICCVNTRTTARSFTRMMR